MRIEVYTIMCQVYLLPYVKVTHTKYLNGYYELSFGWLNKELVIVIG